MKTKSIILNWLFAAILLFSIPQYSIFGQEENVKWSNTPIEIKDIEAVKGLVIKADIPVSEIGPKMGEIFGQLFAYLQSNNIEAAGPPFSVYYSFDPEGNTVFEAGIPVFTENKSGGNIHYKEFEATKAVSTVYTGAYENFMQVYTAMFEYMEKEGIESVGISWEVYLTPPEEMKDPDKSMTQIYFPIKE